MAQAETVVGAVVSLTPPGDGDNTWEARQIEIFRNHPPADNQERRSIEWSRGPVQIHGYVDLNTFEIGPGITVAGTNVGTIYGNLKDGVRLNIDLMTAKGEIRHYLKNGNELWVHMDVKIVFDGHFEGDYKIMSF